MTENSNSAAGSLETPEDTGLNPSGVVKRWALEIKLAEKERKEWLKDAGDAIRIYSGEKRKANSFNILWANTETLRPALYNTLPNTDIRKRWDDEDEAGDVASEMMQRSLTYSLDAYGADSVFKMVSLDTVLTGRAIARIRYIPSFAGMEQEEGQEEAAEQLTHEQSVCEHVQYDDFLHGPGKTWGEVTWVAFRHRLTRDQLVDKFGEAGHAVELDSVTDEDINKSDSAVANVFKTAEVWEIWDKDERKVLFIALAMRDKPLSTVDDPLGLQQFFPVPEPICAIEKSNSLMPTVPYQLYKEQAEELNLISDRINKITRVLKLRGVYDSNLGEIANLAQATDNQMIPLTNAALWNDRGGLDKAIWMMPIDAAIQALQALEMQRGACKQTIYEITGISDIVRGASNAQETATAQQIKAQFGTLRLQRLQREIQRFIRDVVRLMGEVIAEKFQPQSLMMMSGLNLPDEAMAQQQIAAMQEQYQALAMHAQQAGQQPPALPQMPKPVTLEAVMSILRNDLARSYRIDIETDSTIQAMEGADQRAIGELLQGISGLVQSIGPAIQIGLMTKEAGRAILQSLVRKYKLGQSVEDELEQAPESTGMPPEIQQAMQQLQEGQKQLQQKAAEIDQAGQKLNSEQQDLEHQKQIQAMQYEQDQMKLDHAAEMHKLQTEKANAETVLSIQQMLDQHRDSIQALLTPAVSAPI